jgi:hypothetical protein
MLLTYDSRGAGCIASSSRDRTPGNTLMNSPIISERSLSGTRMLDAAKGILVGLRGYTMADAFSEILSVAAEYGVGPLSVSHALVGLAEGSGQRAAGSGQRAAGSGQRAAGKNTSHPPTKPPTGRGRLWWAGTHSRSTVATVRSLRASRQGGGNSPVAPQSFSPPIAVTGTTSGLSTAMFRNFCPNLGSFGAIDSGQCTVTLSAITLCH